MPSEHFVICAEENLSRLLTFCAIFFGSYIKFETTSFTVRKPLATWTSVNKGGYRYTPRYCAPHRMFSLRVPGVTSAGIPEMLSLEKPLSRPRSVHSLRPQLTLKQL